MTMKKMDMPRFEESTTTRVGSHIKIDLITLITAS